MKRAILLSAALLVGCGKKLVVQDRYYSLVLEAAGDRSLAVNGQPRARVDIVEVTMPDFLRSRSLVLQVSTNEVIHARHHHWGEPLDDAVRKVLAWDLAEAVPTHAITLGHGRNADCSLRLEFDRFHASEGAKVMVSGRYTLRQGDREVHREFDVTQVQRGDGYTAAVTAMRGALRTLSGQMQEVVAACVPPPEPAAP